MCPACDGSGMVCIAKKCPWDVPVLELQCPADCPRMVDCPVCKGTGEKRGP